jgi:hypothetical protein
VFGACTALGVPAWISVVAGDSIIERTWGANGSYGFACDRGRPRRYSQAVQQDNIKARMGATHFLMKTLPRVALGMALHVLAYNLTRVMNIMAFGRSWSR